MDWVSSPLFVMIYASQRARMTYSVVPMSPIIQNLNAVKQTVVTEESRQQGKCLKKSFHAAQPPLGDLLSLRSFIDKLYCSPPSVLLLQNVGIGVW